jgi:chemotaxis signal transduction protein
MGLYKGIEIPDELMGVIDHMRQLEQDREELSVLSQQWDLLTILGQMTGSGTDMTKTREGFKVLTAKLLTALGHETLHKTVQGLNAKAQVAVDIVIRNLFERTADIGFLATDDDVRSFLQDSGNQTKSDALRQRFAEYVAKYSVYENIILLDVNGNLLCQLDPNNKMTESDPQIVKEALETSKTYVETFTKTPLCPGKEKSLLYSFRVCESNDPKSKAVGVLCLVFRFENEMEGVFKNLLPDNDWTVLSLLDQTGKVIATSDGSQIPVNSPQVLAIDDEFKLTKFGGRLYLSKTCATKGYQGFSGLGWYGHAMIPIQHAFSNHDASEHEIEQNVLDSIMDEPKLFSDQLRAIPKDAKSIQSELDRTVWNGNLATHAGSDPQHSSSNKVLLWEISVTGNKTKNVFEHSINELHQTVANSILTDVGFVASLSIDIMDRNLFERSDDCRWWALTTEFKKILSQPSQTASDVQRIQEILVYINGLYTVYTNLFVFDNNGKVLAVSNSSESSLVGRNISDDFTKSVLSLRNSQKYRVSSFQKTDLYANRPTYIYGSAILDAETSSQPVGGIGIVFDSEPQFKAMLEDALPRDKTGNIIEGCFSVFVDRSGSIISTTSRQHQIGQTLEAPDQFFNLKNGEKYSDVIELNGQYFAVGACCSKGYREFKGNNDDYKNDIIAMTFMSLGVIKKKSNSLAHSQQQNFKIRNTIRTPGVNYVDVATFHVGSLWIGIRSEHVQASMMAERITSVPSANKAVRGVVMFGEQPIYLIDGYTSLGVDRPASEGPLEVVVVKTDFGQIGVVVDKLGEIPIVPENQIVADKLLASEGTDYVEGIVRLESDKREPHMLVMVHPSEFVKCLLGGHSSEAIKAMVANADAAMAEPSIEQKAS